MKLAALALLLVAFVGVLRDHLFWMRYFSAVGQAAGLPVSFQKPLELVPGGNEPPAPRVAPELESLDTKALEAAAAYAADRNSKALIVSRHDHIVFERYWQGTGFDTVEDSQSFSRILIALGVGIAITNRQIGWPDEPIGTFISEWSGDPRASITVRNLLQLSSGLGPGPTSRGSALNPWSTTARESFGTDVVAEYLSRPLAGTPGATWADQSSDPQLMSLVLERATRQRYASFLSNSLWRRIGAGDAWLWLDRSGGSAHADCCLLARQGDWIRVAELLLKDGNYRGDEIIRPGWIAQLLRPAKGNPVYGSFVRIGERGTAGSEPYAMSDVFVVDSDRGNRLWLVPSLQLAILRTGALPTDRPRDRPTDWDDSRIPNIIMRGARDYIPPQARPGADLSKLVPHH